MSIVISPSYRSTLGRKPDSPAFYYALHNDAAGGTAVVDRFGNARDLSLSGTLGTSWSKNRGFWTPNGTDQQAIMSSGAGEDYAAQDVMANALLTPGAGLLIGWLIRWDSAKTTTNETVVCLGRSHSTSAAVLIGHNSSGSVLLQYRGLSASGSTSPTFGSAGSFVADTEYAVLVHMTAKANGFDATAYLDGVSIGTQQECLWTNSSGTVPLLSTFAMPDGITIGAMRTGGNPAAPSWLQRVGASTTQNTRIACVAGATMAVASESTALAVALEMHQYRRAIGEIFGSL